MSVVFERAQYNHTHAVSAVRSLELRQTPHLYQSHFEGPSTDEGSSNATIISNLYNDLATNWLYSATLQLTMNGSQPPWSHDGWSFIPLRLDQLEAESIIQDVGNSSFNPKTTVMVSTPAIRGRIQCTQYQDLENTSDWLTKRDLTNTSFWNASTIPQNITTGFEPGVEGRGWGAPIWPDFLNTRFLADGTLPACCNNGTAWPPIASAFGNWSPLRSLDGSTTRMELPFNFTVKWVHGRLIPGIQIRQTHEMMHHGDEIIEHLMFLDIPAIQLLECIPVIEKASANVTVDRVSGHVIDFKITEELENAVEAWVDNFKRQDSWDHGFYYNVTISYGIHFMMSMLRSASIWGYTGYATHEGRYTENLGDQSFNFRDTERGLNLDFMAYAMFSLVNQDPRALLDAKTMETAAKKTFTTFFQHYVSSNVSLETGSWAYQPINYTLPECLGDFNGSTCNHPIKWPISHTNRTTTAEISTEIQLLQTNAVAVWLSVSILAWLIITTLVVMALQRKYLKNLKGDVACVADTLALVAGSDKLLRVLQERGEGNIEDGDAIRTKLGWFEDRDGQQRWGIEVVDREDGGDA